MNEDHSNQTSARNWGKLISEILNYEFLWAFLVEVALIFWISSEFFSAVARPKMAVCLLGFSVILFFLYITLKLSKSQTTPKYQRYVWWALAVPIVGVVTGCVWAISVLDEKWNLENEPNVIPSLVKLHEGGHDQITRVLISNPSDSWIYRVTLLIHVVNGSVPIETVQTSLSNPQTSDKFREPSAEPNPVKGLVGVDAAAGDFVFPATTALLSVSPALFAPSNGLSYVTLGDRNTVSNGLTYVTPESPIGGSNYLSLVSGPIPMLDFSGAQGRLSELPADSILVSNEWLFRVHFPASSGRLLILYSLAPKESRALWIRGTARRPSWAEISLLEYSKNSIELRVDTNNTVFWNGPSSNSIFWTFFPYALRTDLDFGLTANAPVPTNLANYTYGKKPIELRLDTNDMGYWQRSPLYYRGSEKPIELPVGTNNIGF